MLRTSAAKLQILEQNALIPHKTRACSTVPVVSMAPLNQFPSHWRPLSFLTDRENQRKQQRDQYDIENEECGADFDVLQKARRHTIPYQKELPGRHCYRVEQIIAAPAMPAILGVRIKLAG